MLTNWRAVSVGVADLDQALALWRDTLGLETAASKSGPDPDLEALWCIDAGQVVRQALLGTPGQATGQVHLVEFAQPGEPVRQGAEVFDWCPKNLDIYARDLPQRVAELKAQGRRFRSETYSEVAAPDGTIFREIHLPSHDEINVVLLEVLGENHPFSSQGFAGVGPLITIVSDADTERQFVAEHLGMPLRTENRLSGPDIEKMVGLPQGASLNVSIWGAPDTAFGQLEIIEYGGVVGLDRYPLAVPPNLGVLHANYEIPDILALAHRLRAAGTAFETTGPVSTLVGDGQVLSVKTPAGLRMDIFGN